MDLLPSSPCLAAGQGCSALLCYQGCSSVGSWPLMLLLQLMALRRCKQQSASCSLPCSSRQRHIAWGWLSPQPGSGVSAVGGPSGRPGQVATHGLCWAGVSGICAVTFSMATSPSLAGWVPSPATPGPHLASVSCRSSCTRLCEQEKHRAVLAVRRQG